MSDISPKTRCLLAGVFTSFASGCANIPTDNPDKTPLSLKMITPSCSLADVNYIKYKSYNFFFEQSQIVGVGDTNHSKGHLLAQKLDDEYCDLVAAQGVTHVYAEKSISRQADIDQYFNDEMTFEELESYIYDHTDDCWLDTQEKKTIYAKATASLYRKMKQDGITLSYVDPKTFISDRLKKLLQNLQDLDVLNNDVCDIFNSDEDTKYTDEQMKTVIEFLEELSRLRDLDDPAILNNIVSKQKGLNTNALIIYGEGHFNNAPHSLSKITTSFAVHFERSTAIMNMALNDVNADYALIPSDGVDIFMRSENGELREKPEFKLEAP